MNLDHAEIDRIVRDVLARLGAAVVPAPTPPTNTQQNSKPTPAASNDSSPPEPPKPDPSRYVVAERVVTLATLNGNLNGAAVVAVRRGAVITPAVRDELKSRNIRLEYYDAARPGAASQSDLPRLIVGVADVAWDVSAALDAIGGHVQGLATLGSLQHADLPSLVRRMSETITSRPALGLVLTARPAAAVCLANRFPGVRAIWGCNVRAVQEALPSVAPNVLAYNPNNVPAREQRMLVREFVTPGLRPCPADLGREPA